MPDLLRGRSNRPYVQQPITQFSKTIGTSRIPVIDDTAFVSGYLDSILIGVPNAASQGIFFGDITVTIGNGFPVEPGSSVNLVLDNQRQLYELQGPLDNITTTLQCRTEQGIDIPVIVFDPSQIFVVASANTDTRFVLFPTVYI
jgi:hypothetical protein